MPYWYRGFESHLSLAAWEARLEVHSDGLCEKIAAIWVKMLPCCLWLVLETGMMVLVGGGGEGRRGSGRLWLCVWVGQGCE